MRRLLVVLLIACGAAGFQTHYIPWRVPLAQAPPDWTSAFIAVWEMEEASGTRANKVGTLCEGVQTNDCDLTEGSTTVGTDTSNKLQGSASADNDGSTEWLECSSDCETSSYMDASGDFSYACFLRPDNSQTTNWAGKYVGATTQGYRGFLTSSTRDPSCAIDGTGGEVADSYATTYPIGSYFHVACVVVNSGGTKTVDTHYNGASNGATTFTTSCCDNSATFQVGTVGGSAFDFDGREDECVFIHAALTTQESCRLCSCLVDGSACACSDRAPALYKRCATNSECWPPGGSVNGICSNGFCKGWNATICGSCTLPACNAAAPS